MRILYGAMPPGISRGEIEDHGAFCVWWYEQPAHRGARAPSVRRWAYARRSTPISFAIGACRSNYPTREDAIYAGRRATQCGE